MAPPTKKLKRSGPSAAELPPDLWAKALDYLYFDEVLPLTAVSKSFLRDVPPLVKRLRVRSGESMAVSSVAAARFCGVEDVYVFSFTDSGYVPHFCNGRDFATDDFESMRKHTYHLDQATLRNVVPFLSNFPKLELCYLGSPSSKEARIDGMRRNRSPTVEYDDTHWFDIPDHKTKMVELLESACLAYSQGRLSENFSIGGWLPDQYVTEERPCMWKGRGAECKLCDMICQSIAPLQVLNLDDHQIPCIPYSERISIATSRDQENCRSILTDMLMEELAHLGVSSIMIPPDYSTEYHQTHCSESTGSKLSSLISCGANAKDSRVRNTLITYCEKGIDRPIGNGEPARTFAGGKRIMSIESYRRLEGLGFDIYESDFLLVDTSDKRTNWSLFMFRKDKAQLDPEKTRLAKERFQAAFNVDMEEAEQRIKSYIESEGIWYNFTQRRMQWKLAEWLNISIGDLKEHKEAVNALILECGSWE